MNVKTLSNQSVITGLNHVKNAAMYFEDAKLSENRSGSGKDFLNALITKLNWIERELLARLKQDDVKQAVKNELDNSATLDSINNIAVALPHMMREEMEEYGQKLLDEFRAFKKEFGHLSPDEMKEAMRELAAQYQQSETSN